MMGDTRGRLYLREGRQLVAHGKYLTAEHAYFDAIKEATSAGDAETGVLFIANARLANLYKLTNRSIESYCCAHEALMLAHRVLSRALIAYSKPLRSAMNELNILYIFRTDESRENRIGSYSISDLRRIRVDKNLFPTTSDKAPRPLQEYSHLLTFQYRRDIIHDCLEKTKFRKNRGGSRRNKRNFRGDAEENSSSIADTIVASSTITGQNMSLL